MLFPLACAALALASGARATISILEPNGAITWFTNNTVTVKWTSLPSDPSPFRIQLYNPDSNLLNNNLSIADSVPTANLAVTILLPGVGYGDGYIVSFINPNKTSEIFAESQPFKIEAGNVTTSTAASAASTSATRNTAIPGAATISTSAAASATSSAAPASAAMHQLAGPWSAVAGVVGAAVALLAAGAVAL